MQVILQRHNKLQCERQCALRLAGSSAPGSSHTAVGTLRVTNYMSHGAAFGSTKGQSHLTLPRSKSDPFCKSVPISMPATNDSICPREALKLLLGHFPTPPNAPLFCQNHPYGYQSGMYFTRDWFIDSLHDLLIKASINPVGYNGHSFRRGAAHSAAAAEMSDNEIKTLGRWKSDSYKLYTGHDDVRRLKLATSVMRKLRSHPTSTSAPRSR